MSQTDGGDGARWGERVDRRRLTGRLQELVRLPSENPPGNEKEAAGFVAGLCDAIGLDVELHEAEPGRPSVVAQWTGDGESVVGYCSHIDVVPAGERALWTHHPFGGEVSNGRMFGRGTSDAKGPVAAAIEAVAALKEAGFQPAGTLELELVCDEETMGFKGAGHLVEQGIIAPDIAIVGEPTSLRVVCAQRGACWFRITARGRAAHGSAPERGVSAIRHMAEIVLRLEETLPEIDHPLLGGPSIGVGTIQGGEKINIVPATCSIEVDRRSVPGESAETIQASIEAAIDLARGRFPELDADVQLAFFAEPFELGEDAPLVTSVRAAMSEALGRDAGILGFRGASDARFLAARGTEVVVCGPGDIALAHIADEFIDLDELERGAIGYALAFARLLGRRD